MKESSFIGELSGVCKKHFARKNPLPKLKKATDHIWRHHKEQLQSFFRDRFKRRSKNHNPASIGSARTRNYQASTPEKQKKIHALCRKLFANKELVVSGRLQLIGLAQVRKKLGRRWPVFEEFVHETADTVIQLYLGPRDFFIRYEDESYVIIFDKVTQQEGEIKATLIAEEISRRLFAEDEETAAMISVSNDVQKTPAFLLQDSQCLRSTMELIYNQGEETSLHMDIAGSAEDTAALLPPLDKDIACPADDGQACGRVTAQPSAPLSPPEAREISVGVAGQKSNISDAAVDQHINHKRIEIPASGRSVSGKGYTAVQEKERDVSSRIDHIYAPIWNMREPTLRSYICVINTDQTGMGAFCIHKELMGRQLPSVREQYEMAILQAVTQQLVAAHQEGRTDISLCCPVHYETLSRASSWQKYRMVCQSIPAECRPHLCFMVYNLPSSINRVSVSGFVSPLKTHCRALWAEVPSPDFLDFEGLRACSFDGVGICLDDNGYSRAQIKNFSERARKNHMRFTFALGARSIHSVTDAVISRFDCVGGAAIHMPVKLPLLHYKFKYSDMYAQMFKSNNRSL